jgi:type II secretion system protein I
LTRPRTKAFSALGFTLLEVVVALAILMLFLTPILGALSQGMRNVDSVRKRSLALRLAEDRMAMEQALPFPEGETTKDGEFETAPGFRYHLEIVKSPDILLMESAIPSLKGFELHLIVAWDDSGTEKSLRLNTIILQ